MNSTKFGSKVKGFTLVEMIVVIAIIGILAGMLSLFISGFQRDARIESNNNKAQMLHTGFQNLLIQQEINQDRSLFDADAIGATPSNAAYEADQMVYNEIYFRMADGKLDDVVHVISIYATEAPKRNYAQRNTVNADWFDDLEKAILSVVDNTFEGVCAVYIDYEDYAVESAICFELGGAASDADLKVYTTGGNGIGQLMHTINPYAPYTVEANETNTDKQCRKLTSLDAQKTAVKRDGIYFGAYPTAMD